MTSKERQGDSTVKENVDHMPSSQKEKEEEEDDENDFEDEEESWFQEVIVNAWKQHMFAVLVAFVAAAYSHSRLVESSHVAFPSSPTFAPTLNQQRRHSHVDSYKRTAGIFFCPNVTLESAEKNVEVMDFRVPLDLIPALHYHYHVDYIRGEYDKNNDVELTVKSKEYVCMKELASLTSRSLISGNAFAYKTPTASQLHQNQHDDKLELVTPSFTGFAAKFINLSHKPILLHWDGIGGHDHSARLIAEIAPFESVGTATTPGQSFYVSPVSDESHALKRWTLTADSALTVYEPADSFIPEELSKQDYYKYQAQLLNLAYSKDYMIKTQRPWLSTFPRPKPMHCMHAADYIGQSHFVWTENGINHEEVQLELKVESVLPRVFTIDNFLSPNEAQHLIELGKQQGLKPSTLHAGADKNSVDPTTRSSTNAWIERAASPIVDLIYRRAADVLKIDERLLQHTSDKHMEDATHHSIAESIQLVHYGPSEEYSPHHDFVYPSVTHPHQPTRFATLLLYLNTCNEGGETVFPRALSTTHHDGVSVSPRLGKAALFYNVLPDGNVADLSQHGSKPVIQGEKWLANFWVWDPVIN